MLTPEAHEKAAAALAEACNGGKWDTHYASRHKVLWRRRLDAALAVTPEAEGRMGTEGT